MITHEDIKKMAHLARIDVTDTEASKYVQDLDAILVYIEQLNDVDVSLAASHSLQKNITRSDDVSNQEGEYSERLLANAPDVQEGYYKMPKIL